MKVFKIFLPILFLTFFHNPVSAQNNPSQKKLHHVLLFQWADSLNVDVKNEVMSLFKGLPAKVEGFEKIEITDLTMSSDNFDTVLIQVFNSEEALKEYELHPDHKRIAEIGSPLLSGFSEFDYWK